MYQFLKKYLDIQSIILIIFKVLQQNLLKNSTLKVLLNMQNQQEETEFDKTRV